MKKKIGIFLEASPSSGGTFQYNQVLLDAVAALPSDRFTIVAGYTLEIWLEYLQAYDVRSVYIPSGFWGLAIGQGWKLLGLPMGMWRKLCPLFHPIGKALLQEKCDLWIFPSQGPRSFQFPIPALVSIHDLMHRYERHFPESASWWEQVNRERNYSNICRWAKGVLVDSEIGRQQVVESYGMPLERIHVLPYITPRYIEEVVTPSGFDSRQSIPSKFIFYPAQYWEHKNHKRLIEAVSFLKHDLPDLKLVLSGSPNHAFPKIVELVRKHNLTDDVTFLGYVPDEDMPELYRRARALVMPTFYGPTNIPPLEAFTVGCPVAISGIYGMPEQVGDAALLFNPASTAEIAACIRKLWVDDELCALLSKRGKSRIEAWGRKQFDERLRIIIEGIVGIPENSAGR